MTHVSFKGIISKLMLILFLSVLACCYVLKAEANSFYSKASDSDVIYLVDEKSKNSSIKRYVDQLVNSPIRAIKRVYLQKVADIYTLYVVFDKSVKFSPRIHTMPQQLRMSLTFQKDVTCPVCNNFKHRLVQMLQFNKIGQKTLLLDIAFADNVRFISKKYTAHEVKISFNLVKKKRIILDAGHGGNDPGAIGINHDYEKDMALMFAKELRNLLESTGKYTVIMLRQNDRHYPVEERVADVSKMKADILISMHTDSNPVASVRGMSIYTLPEILNGRQTTQEYMNNLHRSRDLAQRIISYVPKNCKIKKDQCRGVELKILKIGIPAILIEVGCLSNKIDHVLLHMKEFRERMNRAILYALDDFFEQRRE